MGNINTLYKQYIIPTVMVGSLTVGAGMFALPYVFSKSGLFVGSIYLIFFTLIFIKINTQYAKIIATRSSKYRFVSYANKYLGKWGYWLSIIAVVVGLLLTLTIYVVLSSSFWELISSSGQGLSNYLFWGVSALAVAMSLKKLLNLDTFLSMAMIAIIMFISFLGTRDGIPSTTPDNTLPGLLLPYGAVLFALYGRAAIGPLEDYYKSARIAWKKATVPIALGTAIPAILFLLFAIGIIGLSPSGVTTDAVSGILNNALLPLPLLGILGLLTIWTSYIVIGTEIKDVLANDLKLHNTFALLVVSAVPILLYIINIGSFVTLVGIAGAIFLAIECALVILMHGKLKGDLSLSDKLVIGLLIAGALHTFITTF
ncbi:MAG: hypothetical protein NUV96_02750 [Candidatus Colwellbacteria bacterium]|nr:hypothetical protein [Candidatus Colwellbacteria bacterium]